MYEQHCAACQRGLTGNGNGPAAVWLYPKPRNFGADCSRSSPPRSALPTDEDLMQSVTRGTAGSSMPSFSYLTETGAARRGAICQIPDHLHPRRAS